MMIRHLKEAIVLDDLFDSLFHVIVVREEFRPGSETLDLHDNLQVVLLKRSMD